MTNRARRWEQEMTGGMRADGGSIVSVHGDVQIQPGAEDTELKALLDLPTVRSPLPATPTPALSSAGIHHR